MGDTQYGDYGAYTAQAPESGADHSVGEMPQSSYPHIEYDGAGTPLYSQNGQQQYQQQSAYQQYYQPAFTTSLEVSPFERTSMGIKARTAGILSYLFGWISGLVILLLERDNRFARFHAMQSLLFFGALSVIERTLAFMPFGADGILRSVVGMAMVIGWIVLINAARKGKYYKLPIFGDYAERFIDKIKIR